jgi:hypothetical protein
MYKVIDAEAYEEALEDIEQLTDEKIQIEAQIEEIAEGVAKYEEFMLGLGKHTDHE